MLRDLDCRIFSPLSESFSNAFEGPWRTRLGHSPLVKVGRSRDPLHAPCAMSLETLTAELLVYLRVSICCLSYSGGRDLEHSPVVKVGRLEPSHAPVRWSRDLDCRPLVHRPSSHPSMRRLMAIGTSTFSLSKNKSWSYPLVVLSPHPSAWPHTSWNMFFDFWQWVRLISNI